jgi:hypothetical protein
MRPQKGKAGGGFYMAGGKGGGGYGRKSTAKELDPNSAYNDADLQAGQDVQHDFGDSSFDANSAQLPFNVGGGDNWFTRIFNPPSQTAIDANNAALMAKVAGGIQNQQALDLAAKERAIQNDITARTVAPYLEPNSPLLGNNYGPLSQQALGERLGVALGKPLGDLGAANAVPLAELANYTTGIQNQVAHTPGGQKAIERNYLDKQVPPLHFGNNSLVFGMNPLAGGTVLKAGGESVNSREEFNKMIDPKTGKMVPIGVSHTIQEKNYFPPSAQAFNDFEGADHVRYSPEEVMGTINSINSRVMPGYSSQVPSNAAPSPTKPRNEKVVPSSNQQQQIPDSFDSDYLDNNDSYDLFPGSRYLRDRMLDYLKRGANYLGRKQYGVPSPK